MASLGELFIELGVFADTKELKKFEDKLKDVVKTTKKNVESNKELQNNMSQFVQGLGAVVTAVAGAAIAINKLTDSLIQNNQTWVNFTRQTDLGLQTFQKYGSVASALDKSLGMEGAAGTLEQLNKRLFELRLTGEGARGFQIAGINPIGQDAEGVLEQIRQRIQGLDNTSATYLLEQMGIDPRMLAMLRLTREEFAALNGELQRYRLTDEQRASIQQMNMQISIANQKLRYFRDRAVLALMPIWAKLVESFARVVELLARMGKAVADFTAKWRGLVAGVVIAIGRMQPVRTFFSSLSTSITGLIAKIPIFGRLFMTLGGVFAKALLPLTALYLLLDDIATYMQGGDSLIGRGLDWLKEQGGDFGSIGQTFASGDIGTGIKDSIIKLIDVLDDFVIAIGKFLRILTGLPVDKWFENIGNFVSGGAREQLKNYDYNHPIVTPQMQRSLSYSTVNNYDNRQVNMQNEIATTQPAFDISQELFNANYYFAMA